MTCVQNFKYLDIAFSWNMCRNKYTYKIRAPTTYSRHFEGLFFTVLQLSNILHWGRSFFWPTISLAFQCLHGHERLLG